MDVELSSETENKGLNRKVAITVVALSVFTGLCNIKDGNIVQAMQAAQSASVDSWNEYQATKLKLHMREVERQQIALLAPPDKAAPVLAEIDKEIARYEKKAPGLADQAKGQTAQYDALNIHDDQFDASEALISTAISIAAVAALVESGWLLLGAWGFGAFGVFMGLCGFFRWGFHPDILSTLLG